MTSDTRPSHFSHATLKRWEWPGNEANSRGLKQQRLNKRRTQATSEHHYAVVPSSLKERGFCIQAFPYFQHIRENLKGMVYNDDVWTLFVMWLQISVYLPTQLSELTCETRLGL